LRAVLLGEPSPGVLRSPQLVGSSGSVPPDRYGLAASSRYADRWHRVPPVEHGLDAFLEATEEAVIRGRYEAVFCSEDAQALGLSFGRDRLSARVLYPAHEVVARAFDKLELSRAAHRVGMATPWTAPADDGTIAEVDLPVLVKPRLHWTPASADAPARLEPEICSDRDAVHRRVAVIRGHGGEAVLQDVIKGRLVHYLVIVDGSNEILGGVQTLAEPLAVSLSADACGERGRMPGQDDDAHAVPSRQPLGREQRERVLHQRPSSDEAVPRESPPSLISLAECFGVRAARISASGL